jgi:hypothetical protein
MTQEDPATVAAAVANILDTPIPEQPSATGELVRIRSATRRVLEANLQKEDEMRLLQAIARQAARAELPLWAFDAMHAEIIAPEPWPTPPLDWERSQRRFIRQGLSECPVCRTPVVSERELDRFARRRGWNMEAAEVRRDAAPLAGVASR